MQRMPQPQSVRRRKLLFICGSMNQTTQMHAIARELSEYDQYFTPYYTTGVLEGLRRAGFLEMTIAGDRWSQHCRDYLRDNNLAMDYRGLANDYDLVVTCQDQLYQHNIRDKPVILVQEGMTDPENFLFRVSKRLPFIPRWIAGTSATGQSKLYRKFCVASEGYRAYFARHGIPEDKLVVTGIPNFDDCARYRDNQFPHHGFALVCTSDGRETFKFDDRKKFIERATAAASGRPMIFKLHPNEKVDRAIAEIERWAPGSLIYRDGNAEEMVANCDVLICQYSSLVFVGLALGKEVHSYFDVEVRDLLPEQNRSGSVNIAGVCRKVLGEQEAYEPIRVPPPRVPARYATVPR